MAADSQDKDLAIARGLGGVVNAFPLYASKYLKIRTARGGLIPFDLNAPQRRMHALAEAQRARLGYVRVILLKARQWGGSTYIEGRGFWKTCTRFAHKTYILTHELDATKNMFEMVQVFHQYLPEHMRPSTRFSNAKELVFDRLNSQYVIATAKRKQGGRSQTLQYLHCSECAFYPDFEGTEQSLMNAVHAVENTEVWLESTGNGQNHFYNKWRSAVKELDDYAPIFVPWFEVEEYQADRPPPNFEFTAEDEQYQRLFKLTDRQMNWRAKKIANAATETARTRFGIEFPATPDEAFMGLDDDTVIQGHEVLACRQAPLREPYGPAVLGVDPAWIGRRVDRSAIMWRCPNRAEILFKEKNVNTTFVAAKVLEILKNPPFGIPITRVNIDTVGIGAGVRDQCLGHGFDKIIHMVHANGRSRDPRHYENLRAEMVGEMAKWIRDPATPCLPDSPDLQSDLLFYKPLPDHSNRLKLISKAEIKKGQTPSPDLGDALALTFALPLSTVKSGTNRGQPDPDREYDWQVGG